MSTSQKNVELIAEHTLITPLMDRLRGKSFIPGVHYASQADAWMIEAADRIEELEAQLKQRDVASSNLLSEVMLPISKEFLAFCKLQLTANSNFTDRIAVLENNVEMLFKASSD